MIRLTRHLHDDRLYEHYFSEENGEPLDPRLAEHLADCAECARRYQSLSTFMDGVRADADSQVDEMFTADELRGQQQQIARRIEQLGHAARVINFPGHPTSHHHIAGRRSSLTPRFIAGAAAAGLLIGIFVGSGFFGPVRLGPRMQEAAMARAVAPSPHIAEPAILRAAPEPEVQTAEGDGYDRFLEELELAGDRPHTPELVALDDLTPHVRPVRAGLR